ncbi:hypothetical protein AEB_P1782 [Altererythrobacter sp. B11]|uniref:hypothetical protein n=1 Tax=Altererythrobacter sp. B11 TaxID=2060312 RepID=UPI000DC70411|nr:hypothetical protein [Altererythrobacter sp. B11]BBC72650.1 hypothetical protein AEB_P1782 [Altererythrobacter sp. B11]
MNEQSETKRIRTIAINIRLDDEPMSVMSLRLLKAAASLHEIDGEVDFWSEGPPVVQLGSLEAHGGYLRRVEGSMVGEVPAGDPGGAVMRVASKASVLAIDAPVDLSNVGEAGEKISSIINAGRDLGTWVVPYIVCSNHAPSERQERLRTGLLPHRVLVSTESDPRYDLLRHWQGVKNEAVPNLPHDYLDTRGKPLVEYLSQTGDRSVSSLRFHLHIVTEMMRSRGFIHNLLVGRRE